MDRGSVAVAFMAFVLVMSFAAPALASTGVQDSGERYQVTTVPEPETTTQQPTTVSQTATTAVETTEETTQTATPTSTPTPTPTPTATPTPTPTPAPEPPEIREELRAGQYDISMLRQVGVSPGNTTDEGVYALGDPPAGFISLRYNDPTLFDQVLGSEGQTKYVGKEDTVRQNSIEVYGSAFGEISGEYQIVLVYWQEKQGQYQNNTVTYAGEQRIDRKTVTIRESELYSSNTISLREHYDETWKVTAWAERDGERVEGVQWHFNHRSNPQAQAVDIESAGGAWGFAIRTTLLPGIAALVGGLVLSQLTLRKTARGPGYGILSWLFVVGFVAFFIAMLAFYQIAVILSNVPYIMGGSIGLIAYSAGLTFHEPEKRIAFMRRELADAITIPGRDGVPDMGDDDAGASSFEELTEALKVDLPEVPAVKTSDGYKVPEVGVKAFFARLFADPAILDVESIAARDMVGEGRIDEIIHVSPDSERALVHKPARLVRVLPIDTMEEDADWVQESISYILSAAIAFVPAAAGGLLFHNLWNIPSVGVAAGLLISTIVAFSAEDGWVEFEEAEFHYKKAEDSLTYLQRAHKEAKDQMDEQEDIYQERVKSVKEAKQEMESGRETVTDKILESMGAEGATEEDKDNE